MKQRMTAIGPDSAEIVTADIKSVRRKDGFAQDISLPNRDAA